VSASISPRRIVILAEGQFGPHHGKTAMGVLRYGPDPVVAVIDSTNLGRNVREWLGDAPRFDVPIVGSLEEALALGRAHETPVTALLIGIAPTGGRLPQSWRDTILAAIGDGLDILSGLHTMLADDPEYSSAAAVAGVSIVDYRRPPERMETAVGRVHGAGKKVILTVGTDCAIGKMSVALELRRAATDDGLRAAFVPTGQTGIMIEGWGIAVDRVISDFSNGICEWLVEQAEDKGDWIFVEGQGSLDHPAYSAVTLGLIHGCTPQAMIMVHKPLLDEHDWDHVEGRSFPLSPLPAFIRIHEQVAALVAPSRVVGVALNTSLISDEADARRVIEATAAQAGLPCDDPVRFGPHALWRAIRPVVEALAP
jgi:D-glutamate N-acetyltransferase